jgi:hypothetical protein
MLHPVLKNVLQTIDHFEISYLGASFTWLDGKAQKLLGGCSDGVPPIHFFQAKHRIQSVSCPMQFLGFSNHEAGALRQELLK